MPQYFCPTQYVTLLLLSYKAHLYSCHKSNNDYLLKLFCIICPTSPFGQPTFNSQSTQIVLASLSACIVTFSSPSKVTRSPQKGLSFSLDLFFRNFRMLRRYTLLNMYYRVLQPGTPYALERAPVYIHTWYDLTGKGISLRRLQFSPLLLSLKPPLTSRTAVGGKRPG